jgi:hypothetical protein
MQQDRRTHVSVVKNIQSASFNFVKCFIFLYCIEYRANKPILIKYPIYYQIWAVTANILHKQ